MAEQDLDRSHAATPHKLKEARKRGQVAKSNEVVAVIVFTVATVFVYWRGWETIRDQFRMDAQLLAYAGRIDGSAAAMQQLLSFAIKGSVAILGPFFLTLMLAAIVANLIQTGPLFSLHPIKPDFSRLSLARGWKKLFSGRALFELARMLTKLVLLGFVVYQSLEALIPRFFVIASMSPAGYLRTLVDSLAGTGLKIAMMLAAIALVDLIYTKRQFAKQMRMSGREMKDENKQREGDPRIRARLRKLRGEMRKRSQSVINTRNADVVITNPTHLAIALRYEHGVMMSPQLVAKGAGTVAAVMRGIAARNNIPIVQNPPLARKLFRQVDFDQHVPESLYADVARIIVWVFAMRKAKGASRAGRP